MQKNKLIDTGF